MIQPLPRILRVVVGGLGGAVALSALAMALAVVFLAPKPVWVVFGFELCAAGAGVIAWLFARGRFQDGQGLALACVAGTIAVGAALSALGTPRGVAFGEHAAPQSLWSWSLWRLAAAGAIGAIGAYAVLRRSRDSRGHLARAILLGAPVIAGLLAGYRWRSALSATFREWPGALQAGAAAVLGIVVVVLVSLAGHALIRAFECGRDEPATNG